MAEKTTEQIARFAADGVIAHQKLFSDSVNIYKALLSQIEALEKRVAELENPKPPRASTCDGGTMLFASSGDCAEDSEK